MRSGSLTLRMQRAATLVEFAMIFPVVLFIVLVVIDTFLFLAAQGTVERAAKQAAAFAAVVDGLENVDVDGNPDNEVAVAAVEQKALELPLIALTKMADVQPQDIEYQPPWGNEEQTILDYVNVPVGVRIRATYRPIMPFLPREFEVTGFAYREQSETSSLPVPLDCRGQRIVPGVTIPITSCPCPGSNDPFNRRQDEHDSTICDCIPNARQSDATGVCECPEGAQYNPQTDECKCIVRGAVITPDHQCACPSDSEEAELANNGGQICRCKRPLIGDPGNCRCQFPTCGPGSIPDPDRECACKCNSENTVWNPQTNKCDCKLDANTCPDGWYKTGNCQCQLCPPDTVPNADRTACLCSEAMITACGGPEFTTINSDGSCACKGECKFEDDNGNPIYSAGNCICPKELLFERCGGEANSNLQYCNCRCINPKPGEKCECNIESQIAFCTENGLPTDFEHCGCKEGVCTGETVLRDGRCVCPDSVDEVVIRKQCQERGQVFNPEKCECEPATCESILINERGECACTRETLAAACGARGLPILDLTKCSCGTDCGPNKAPDGSGACACIPLNCPDGATQNPNNNCQCECSGGLPVAYCEGTGRDACVRGGGQFCLENPGACYCDAGGIFRPPGD